VATATAPRRVRLADATITRGATFRIQRLGIAHDQSPAGETLGPVTALDLAR